MSRIFISHSHKDNAASLAFKAWLASAGWGAEDVFLDLHALEAGVPWREALRQANERCEAVVLLASPDSLESAACHAEIRMAEDLGKELLIVILRDLEVTDPRLLPFTERHIVRLDAAPRDVSLDVSWKGAAQTVTFNGDALARVAARLASLGLAPDHFPWTPADPENASPYPGLAGFTPKDAGVFFGRTADISRGLTEIRRLARAEQGGVLAILAASGAGKSSYLKAGLWPRLGRDADLLPVAILRPGDGALRGGAGLFPMLAQAATAHGLLHSPAQIAARIEEGGAGALAGLLHDICAREHAARRVADPDAAMPAPILAIDQAEELFGPTPAPEADTLVKLLAGLRDPSLVADMPAPLILLTVRADSVDDMMRGLRDAGLDRAEAFPLPPIAPTAYRDAILRPAEIAQAAGIDIRIDEALADAMVADADGADALPLLAFALKTLVEEHRIGRRAHLSLDHYEAMGGVGGALSRQLGKIRAELGMTPDRFEADLRLLTLPHLTTWDAEATPPGAKRLVARTESLFTGPRAGLRPLADALVEGRLLTSGDGTLDVAHEALLRAPPISKWLEEDKEFLSWRDRLQRERLAAAENRRGLLVGRELELARSFLGDRGSELAADDRAFITQSDAADQRAREDALQQEREKRAAAETLTRRTRGLLAVVVLLLFGAIGLALWAFDQQNRATLAQRAAQDAATAEETARIAAEAAEAEALREARRAEAEAARAVAALERQIESEAAAERAAAEADAARIAAETAEQDALAQSERAQSAERDALETQSQFLADLAAQATDEGDALGALHLAVAGTPEGDDRPLVPEIVVALDEVLRGYIPHIALSTTWGTRSDRLFDPERGRSYHIARDAQAGQSRIVVQRMSDGHVTHRIGADVTSLGYLTLSPDGAQLFASGSGGRLFLWRTADMTLLAEGTAPHPVSLRAEVLPGGGQVLFDTSEGPYLWQTGDSEAQPLSGPQRWGFPVADDTGRWLVTSPFQGTARLVEADTGTSLFDIGGAERALSHATFSSDGTRLLLRFEDGWTGLLDLTTGDTPGVLFARRGAGRPHFLPGEARVIYAPDPARLTVVTADQSAQDMDFVLGEEIEDWQLSDDGARLMARGETRLNVWDTANGTLLLSREVILDWRNEAQLSPDGGLVVLQRDGVDVLPVAQDAAPIRLDNVTGQVEGLVFLNDGQRLLLAGPEFGVQMHDLSHGDEAGRPTEVYFAMDMGPIRQLALSADESRVAARDESGTVHVWHTESTALIASFRSEESVSDMTFVDDGLLIDSYGTPTLYLRGPLIPAPVTGPEIFDFIDLAVSADRTRFITHGSFGLALFDASSRAIIAELADAMVQERGLDLSPDGRVALYSDNRAGVHLWEPELGRVQTVLPPYDGNAYQAAFAPDGRSAAIVHEGDAVILDIASGTVLRRLETGAGDITSLAYDATGTRLLAGYGGGRLVLFDAATGAPLPQDFAGLPQEGELLADFALDGTRIVAVMSDTLHIWDAETAALLHTATLPDTNFSELAVAPDGTWFATGAHEGHALAWNVESGNVRTTLRRQGSQVTRLDIDAETGAVLIADVFGAVQRYEPDVDALVPMLGSTPAAAGFSAWFMEGGEWMLTQGGGYPLQLWPRVGVAALVDTARALSAAMPPMDLEERCRTYLETRATCAQLDDL